MKTIIHKCLTCGKEYIPYKYRPVSGYCSRNCWYGRHDVTGHYTRIKNPKRCAVCNKYFISPFTPEAHKRAKCCSYKCHQILCGRRGGTVRAKQVFGKGKKDWYLKRNDVHIHRSIMEGHLGRSLLPSEIVHHCDGNKRNNTITNLKVMSQKEHARLHFMNARHHETIPISKRRCTTID